MRKIRPEGLNLHNADKVEDHCKCDFFNITDYVAEINFAADQSQTIIERYSLEPLFKGPVHKKMIQYGNIIPKEIKGEEIHFAIEHFDFSEPVGKIFLCKSSVFVKNKRFSSQ